MRWFAWLTVSCVLWVAPVTALEYGPRPGVVGEDPFATMESIHPFSGDPSYDAFLREYLFDRPENMREGLRTAFPDVEIQPIFLGGGPSWRSLVAVTLPLAGIVALAWAWVLAGAGASRRRRVRTVASVGVASLVFGVTAWHVAPTFWQAWWTVPHEGNSGRTLLQIYQLFHREFVRRETIWLLRWLLPGDPMPPVMSAARLTIASLAASIPLLFAVGLAMGAGVLLAAVGALAILVNPLVSQYALSDHPIGGVALFTALTFLALDRAWRVQGGRRERVAIGLSLACFQLILAELRSETLVLWALADMIIAIAWSRGTTPDQMCARWSDSLKETLRRRAWTIGGTAAAVLGALVLVLLPAFFQWLPFWLLDSPRVSVYYPFMMPTAAWGLFVPGLIRMASELAPATIVLVVFGLGFGLLRPLAARGVGLAVAAVVSAGWIVGHSHPDWVYSRLTASLVPVMVLLGIQALSRLERLQRIAIATFLVGLTVVLPLFGTGEGGGHWLERMTNPPLRYVDNVVEAHAVFDRIVTMGGGCVVAPVLAPERPEAETVPRDRRLIDLLVMSRDEAFRVPVRLPDEDGDALVEAIVAAATACSGSVAYLGLDCALQGLHFCTSIRDRLHVEATENVVGAVYTAPVNYGRRAQERVLDFLRIPPPDEYKVMHDVIPGGWR